MKRILLAVMIVSSLGFLGGCCSDMGCGVGTTYVATTSCSTCSAPVVNTCSSCSTCSRCGYDASYTYSGWY